MVKITIDNISQSMNQRHNIRNLSVIAHVDHGKTTLSDSLVSRAGIIPEKVSGDVRWMSARDDEIIRGITIKSSSVSLHFEMPANAPLPAGATSREFLINLIDSPGHVDFSSEVTAALRVTDGALVVVDAIEGVCVQTETVLRQALAERIVPVLFVNKMDRLILELKVEPEDAYIALRNAIEGTNAVVMLGENQVALDPTKGNVGFGSGYQGWGFNLEMWAQLYEAKLGVPKAKMMSRLWGDNFYDSVTKKWSTNQMSEDGRKLERGFCRLIYEPLRALIIAAKDDKIDELVPKLDNLGIKMTQTELELRGKELLRTVMRKFLPVDDCILSMVVNHLPSPITAQKYRTEALYTGPLDDECAKAMRECDPNGPLMMFVSKMIPSDGGRFIAFGRVFSGTVSSGQTVRILQPSYDPDTNPNDFKVKKITNTVLMMGRKVESIDSCPCGNIVGLTGIDAYLVKSGTITSSPAARGIVSMKFSVSPVVRVAVHPKDPSQLPKLIEGIKRVIKTDPAIQHIVDSTGQNILATVGELQLEICLKDLQEFANCEIVASNPVVSYRETVTETSQVCLAKSANKHNRIFVSASPLSLDLANEIENKDLDPTSNDIAARTEYLVGKHSWDINDSKRIWSFGPNLNGPNVFVDRTVGVQYMNEVRDSIVQGFQWASSEGVLADEPLHGVRFDMHDIVLIADGAHRRVAQIMPASRKVLYASEMSAQPRLLEPMYLVDIQAPSRVLKGVHKCLNRRRGIIISEEEKFGMNGVFSVRAHLPVAESFGFSAFLQSETSGLAFLLMTFDHWAVMSQDPLESGSVTNKIIQDIRIRKGLRADIPPLTEFLDRL